MAPAAVVKDETASRYTRCICFNSRLSGLIQQQRRELRGSRIAAEEFNARERIDNTIRAIETNLFDVPAGPRSETLPRDTRRLTRSRSMPVTMSLIHGVVAQYERARLTVISAPRGTRRTTPCPWKSTCRSP